MADVSDIISSSRTRADADGHPVVMFTIACEHPGCAAELLVRRPRLKNGGNSTARARRQTTQPIFVHTIERAMQDAGWAFRRHLARPYCPEHLPHPTVRHAPHTIEPKESVLAVDLRPNGATPLPGPALAAPRQPSRADNVRISDELDAAYDIQAGRYKGDCSDEKVAKKLDVPRVWVTAIRKGFFGDEDRNEAAEDDKAIAAAMDLLAEADAKQKRAADLVAEAKAKVQDAQAELSRARAMLDGVRRGR